jgi:hypothetical protein
MLSDPDGYLRLKAAIGEFAKVVPARTDSAEEEKMRSVAAEDLPV